MSEPSIASLIHDLALQVIKGDMRLRQQGSAPLRSRYIQPMLLVARRMKLEVSLQVEVDGEQRFFL